MDAPQKHTIAGPEAAKYCNKSLQHGLRGGLSHDVAHVLHPAVQRNQVKKRFQHAGLGSEEIVDGLPRHATLGRE